MCKTCATSGEDPSTELPQLLSPLSCLSSIIQLSHNTTSIPSGKLRHRTAL